MRPDAIYSVAKSSGMSRETFDKCLSNQTIIDGLTEVKQRGRQFGVIGTPTFFINGRKAQGEVTFDEIKALIEQAAAAAIVLTCGGPQRCVRSARSAFHIYKADRSVKITRLRLLGFKSFVEPTELLVEPGLTGVVGPNGCGKSNLLEALRWAMGETSYKSMRGAAMEDVIFAGSEAPARRATAPR